MTGRSCYQCWKGVSVNRECAFCGDAFETTRTTARFCSGTCRTRGHRDPAGVRRYPAATGAPVPLRGPHGAPHVTKRPVESAARESVQARYGVPGRPPGAPAAAARLDGLTCAAIRAELVEAGRDEGFLAALAVDLADMIDHSTGTLGFPAIIKELRITMDAALSGANTAADPLDDLRRGRDRKLRGGL